MIISDKANIHSASYVISDSSRVLLYLLSNRIKSLCPTSPLEVSNCSLNNTKGDLKLNIEKRIRFSPIHFSYMFSDKIIAVDWAWNGRDKFERVIVTVMYFS